MMTKDPNDHLSNDNDLLARIAAGDEQAFRRLVDGWWAPVYYNTLTLVKEAAVAQELTQDIFLKLWQQRDKLPAVTNLRNYLYVIGRHQVISALRKKIMLTTSLDAVTATEDMDLPYLRAEGKDTYQLLLEGVARLSPQQQAVFKLSRLEGLSQEEIATALQIAKNTVKVHMVAALNNLRTWMREHLDQGLTIALLTLSWLIKFFFQHH